MIALGVFIAIAVAGFIGLAVLMHDDWRRMPRDGGGADNFDGYDGDGDGGDGD